MKLSATVYDDIKYHETVLFRLTLPQLAFLAPFLLVSYFTLMHIDASPANRIILAIISFILGLYAVRAQFDKKLGYILGYLKRKKKLSFSSTYSIFNIKDIRDDILIFPDKLTAVLRVIPIDFFQKSDTDKETTIEGYCDFINSLTFPAKMLMLSRQQNTTNYFSQLKQAVDKKYYEYIEDLEKHFADLMRDREIYIREFYLCIDYRPVTDYPSAIEELAKRVDAIIKRLEQSGHASERLATSELIPLISRLVIP